MTRSTYTYASLEVSPEAYDEIAAKLKAAGYEHAFLEDGAIDMHGIGVVKASESRALHRLVMLKKGDLVTCTNGHVIGEVLRDIHSGEANTWGTAIGNWRQEDIPVVGSDRKPACQQCGAPFIHPMFWAVHVQGWR